MTPMLSVEDRLTNIENKLIQLEARQGRVQLGGATLSLLWAVMLAAIASVVFVVRLEGKVDAFAGTVAEDHDAIVKHVAEPGHPTTLERLDAQKARIDRLEDRGLTK